MINHIFSDDVVQSMTLHFLCFLVHNSKITLMSIKIPNITEF